jgi:hypothetical protein
LKKAQKITQHTGLFAIIPDRLLAYDRISGKLVYEQNARLAEPLTQKTIELLLFRCKQEHLTFAEALVSHFNDALMVMQKDLERRYPQYRIEIFLTGGITLKAVRPKTPPVSSAQG